MQRIRVYYNKGEELQYIGNLDLHKIWERTFRRAGIPIAYSQGFHPQPRINQACPLPLGFTSSGEVLDFWIDADGSIDEMIRKLKETIQPGLKIETTEIIPLSFPPLQTIVVASRYRVVIDEKVDFDTVNEKISTLFASREIIRERRGKKYDLLPLIESLRVSESSPLTLEMQLSARPGATGRPEEVLDALDIPISSTSIERISLIFQE